MTTYTTILEDPLESISPEDDDFVEKLKEAAGLFRPFSVAMGEFLREHGYVELKEREGKEAGEKVAGGKEESTKEEIEAEIEAKVQFIRSAFLGAGMEPPREIREWFRKGQPIRRETAFALCFAFHLDGWETDEFFRRYYTRERSFNCHKVEEAIYYFCLNHGLSFQDAMDIQERLPLVGKQKEEGEVVYTGSIMEELNQLETKEELVSYLIENIWKFSASNVTAYDYIRALWEKTAGVKGLLSKEREYLPSFQDDLALGKEKSLLVGKTGVQPWEGYLAIFQMDKKEVARLHTERSIKPILEALHADVQDSFPDRQGLQKILSGKVVSYERVRKWLVLLSFYCFYARYAVERKHYRAQEEDAKRCLAYMNNFLVGAGYPELYLGNPYDWLFFYCMKQEEPLYTFRGIFQELLYSKLEGEGKEET